MISRLGIGTVQFGTDYGINNPKGQVSYGEVVTILSRAREMGVNFLDTSRGYGTSEEVLGKAIGELKAQSDFLVCTKLDLPRNWPELSEKAVMEAAKKSFEGSMEALRLEAIPYYMLHKLDYYNYNGGILWEYIKEKQDRGFLRHIGVSIGGGPIEAETAVRDSRMEIIQIPYNLFDWRWDSAGIFDKAASRKVMIVNRSTYLQGLLVMSEDDVIRKLPQAHPYRKRLDEFVIRHKCSLKELVLGYVFSHPGITSTILGLDSPEQFEENLSIFMRKNIGNDVIDEVRKTFKDVPEDILNPGLWKKL